MLKGLKEVRELASAIRFSGDSLIADVSASEYHENSIKDIFYCNELCISKEVTPDLFHSLESVLNRLGIEDHSVEGFVYASPEINAQCFSTEHNSCVIRFTSALVDILSKDEFEFVVGHELGHFLLNHSFARSMVREGIELYMQQRAQEISADRVGLIACKSLDVAVKALLKTISGLGDQHLRFDVGAFLSQLRKTSSNVGQEHTSTHPSILVRCRALLWFSLNNAYLDQSSEYDKSELLSLDKRIQSDIDKYVDSSIRQRINDVKHDLSMWMAAYEIVSDSVFSKEEQEQFAKQFGDELLEKLKSFLGGMSSSEISEAVYRKVKDARAELESLIPASFEEEIKTISKWS